MPLNLPPPLQAMARGSVIGGFEGFAADGNLHGWACPLADPPSAAHPLRVLLQVEDLLNPGRLWSLGDAEASLPRPDLVQQGLALNCGFAFPGRSGMEIPPPLHRPGAARPRPERSRRGTARQPPPP